MQRTETVEVELYDGPLGSPVTDWSVPGAGAVVLFEGVVRPAEDGRPLAGLDYEAYEPMTSNALRQLGLELVAAHGLAGLRVEHSVGHVPNHATSFRLYVAAAHRKEALTAMDVFIDRMKREVPLWKVPVWAEAGDA